jgi:hypothetical protein
MIDLRPEGVMESVLAGINRAARVEGIPECTREEYVITGTATMPNDVYIWVSSGRIEFCAYGFFEDGVLLATYTQSVDGEWFRT